MSALLDIVDNVLIRHREPSVALATLRSAAPLVELMTLIRADPQRLAALADRSYRHHNGFDKIVLASPTESPLKLVLHVWRHRDVDGVDNIHDHRWDFASVVLCGALRLDLYEPNLAGVTYPALRYRPPAGSDSYQMEPGGNMTVSVHASVTMALGSAYSWAADLLHRARGLRERVTATLIVQGPSVREHTTVLVREDEAPSALDGSRRLRRLHPDDVDRTLAMLAVGDVEDAWNPSNIRSDAWNLSNIRSTGSTALTLNEHRLACKGMEG